MSLPFHDVKRLEDTSAHLRRGDRVLAVFPETTSFYPAVVAKNPKPPANNSNTGWDVVVKFDDDEDENGKNPARRVPARFVLRLSQEENESEEEE
jgi:SAGA-associated factor 29